MALYWVENFILCNKHLYFFTKHLSFMTKKVPVVDRNLQLDSVWQYQSEASFKQLVTKKFEIVYGVSASCFILFRKGWLFSIMLEQFSIAFFDD